MLHLMDKNPSRRITSLDKLKQHRFFANFDWDACERRELKPPILLHKDAL